jgi:RNA polymerase-binding transcription factor DksA
VRYLTIEQRESLQRQLSDRAAALRDVEELREVERALKSLHEPDYGVCVDCASDIPYSRLSVNPSAMRCISCQRRVERSRAEPARPALGR